MKIATLRRSRRPPELPGLTGIARVDVRTKNLIKRLRPGDIAVVDHLDLDKVSAEALVAAGVAAVVNASPSTSGRFPNLGPEIVVGAGVPLLDTVGPEVMRAVEEGERLRLDGETLYRDLDMVASGNLLTVEGVHEAMEQARAGLVVQLEAFAGNTTEYLRQERELLLDGVGVPDIRTVLEGRQALVVVRGYDYKEDLAALRPYIGEFLPVLIAVEGGADALIESGYRPDVIVGDMDSVSDAALTSGAELVVHAYRDGSAPGLARLEELGLPSVIFPATGTSEDIAMLLADDKGAELIVAVGTHATLVEFLDKGRAGMASTFLTRLRVGGKLVDARAVSRLYRSQVSSAQLALLVMAGLFALIIALVAIDGGQLASLDLRGGWDSFYSWLQGLF